MLNWIMNQCTHVHVRKCTGSSITKHYNEIRARKGNSNVAIVAAARKLM
jgi:hypothetical protein